MKCDPFLGKQKILMENDECAASSAEPNFFSLLSEEDKAGYADLKEKLCSFQKYKRNKRVESLQEQIEEIRKFCLRNDDEDWKRSLVCGICWMGYDIGINNRQLKLLVGKCKSSINGAISKMGYGTVNIKSEVSARLLEFIPFLKGNFVEQRQWTVRRKINFSPIPDYYSPGMGIDILSPYSTPQPNKPTQVIIQEKKCGPSEFFTVVGIENQSQGSSIPYTESLNQQSDYSDTKYNFLSDPCCCCPVQWVNNNDNIDDYFSYA